MSFVYVIEERFIFRQIARDGEGGGGGGGGEISRTRSGRPWGPSTLLYNGYRLSFSGVKRPERGVNPPFPSSAEVKVRIELHLYFPSVPLWSVLGRTLPLPLRIQYSLSTARVFCTARSRNCSVLACDYGVNWLSQVE